MKKQFLLKVLVSFGLSFLILFFGYKSASDIIFGQEQINTDPVGTITQDAASTDKPDHVKVIPNSISIPSVSIDTQVKVGRVEKNDWILYTDAASYLDTSAGLAEFGNSVIYAHNTQNLFKRLRDVKVDDKVYVQGDNKNYSYTVTETMIVKPTQLDIVYPTNDERLTIFTCTNFNHSDRFVIIAKRATTFGDII